MVLAVRRLLRILIYVTCVCAICVLYAAVEHPGTLDHGTSSTHAPGTGNYRFTPSRSTSSYQYSYVGSLAGEDASIAIGGGLRMSCRGSNHHLQQHDVSQESLFQELLPTFCATASSGFTYYFIFVYDYDDACLSDDVIKAEVEGRFQRMTSRGECGGAEVGGLELLACEYRGKPAWAQNEAMMRAYYRNITYFYRLNDDTLLTTEWWAEHLTLDLSLMSPHNIGVTGPAHRGGNKHILTYDFTHRSHVDIHGFYYPAVFPDWYADNWITDTYARVGRMVKDYSVLVQHTMHAGSRYTAHKTLPQNYSATVNQSVALVEEWLDFVENYTMSFAVGVNVVSVSLHKINQQTVRGAVSHVLLCSRLLPSWQVWVYMGGSDSGGDVGSVLRAYGARVVSVSGAEGKVVPAQLWGYLALDDRRVSRVLVKDVMHQWSPRHARLVDAWTVSMYDFHSNGGTHSEKDYNTFLYSFGAVREKFASVLQQSVHEYFRYARTNEFSATNDLILKFYKELFVKSEPIFT